MLLSVVLPTNGRSAAGVSRTIATHQPAVASSAAPPTRSCQIRLPILCGPHTRYARASAGRARNPASILPRKPRPKSTPAKASHRVRPDSMARVMVYAARVAINVMNASGSLKRKMSVATGVRAMTTPAMIAAAGPNQRRTVV